MVDEGEDGVMSPPEGEQDESHESDDTLSPDEKGEPEGRARER